MKEDIEQVQFLQALDNSGDIGDFSKAISNSEELAQKFNGMDAGMLNTDVGDGVVGIGSSTFDLKATNAFYKGWDNWCDHNNICYHKDTNTTEQAYKILRELMKEKIIKITSINKFFDTMDAIAKAL